MRTGLVVTGGVALLTGLAAVLPGTAASAAASDTSSCVTTASTVVSGVQIADPACEFNGAAYTGAFGPIANSSGAMSRTWTGIASDGAGYRIEVPPDWNGTLVMYAHGYRGTGNVVYTDDPQLRTWYIDHGYAWAASSYAQNNYDPGDGVVDTHDLLESFHAVTGLRYRQAIMTGVSMGGEITTAEIETYKGAYRGAMPACGVLAGNDLFDFFLGANVTAAALTKTTISYPTTYEDGAAYQPAYQAAAESELPSLGIIPNAATGGQTFTTELTALGQEWSAAVEQLSGGTRPGFASALSYWDSFGFAPTTHAPFLFGLYPGLTGGTYLFANGSIAGNTRTFYTLASAGSSRLRVLKEEIALNKAVLRVPVTATSSADSLTQGIGELPAIHGDPGIPVLSVHGIGDLFVPFSMDQIYDRKMIAHGQGNLFVDRAIREVTHCGYTDSEMSSAFTALMNWVNHGIKPAGDNILNAKAVASPKFGCKFTDPTPGAHPEFAGSACPAK